MLWDSGTRKDDRDRDRDLGSATFEIVLLVLTACGLSVDLPRFCSFCCTTFASASRSDLEGRLFEIDVSRIPVAEIVV